MDDNPKKESVEVALLTNGRVQLIIEFDSDERAVDAYQNFISDAATKGLITFNVYTGKLLASKTSFRRRLREMFG